MIRRVRKARPDTIETAQQHYIEKCGPLSVEVRLLDRMLGCLLGGAVGDALGYEVEFKRWPQIEASFGPEGISQPIPHNGKIRVSDDTQMTLFTLEGIVRSKAAIEKNDTDVLVENIRLAYLDWLYTQENSVAGTSQSAKSQQIPGYGSEWLRVTPVLQRFTRVARAPRTSRLTTVRGAAA